MSTYSVTVTVAENRTHQLPVCEELLLLLLSPSPPFSILDYTLWSIYIYREREYIYIYLYIERERVKCISLKCTSQCVLTNVYHRVTSTWVKTRSIARHPGSCPVPLTAVTFPTPGLPSVTTDRLWLSWSFTLLLPCRVCSSVSRFFQHVVKIHPCRRVYHQFVPLGHHVVIHSVAAPQSARSPADGHLGVPHDGASPCGHGCVGFLWAPRVSL